ncbi:MAG: MoaD/ThiS family protein [Candidatus Latescibacteria bacterium]|jgi:molybdopterin converting factor small subunit|nr:MoaD/ThiS family protein [Candidatus Latescibacterota bacterium]
MQIQVRLFATLARHLPAGSDGRTASVCVPEGTKIAQVLDRLGVPPKLAKLTFVDSVHRDPDFVLSEGNTVSVFPPIAGGT